MQILTTILAATLSPLMGLIVWQLQRIITSKSVNTEALKVLLKTTMQRLHEKYTEEGFITSDDLAEFKDMYEIYHKMGGNGRGTIWMNDLDKLERRE